MKYYKISIILGMLLSFQIAFDMNKSNNPSKSITALLVDSFENDIAISKKLKANIEPNILEKLDSKTQEELINFDICDCATHYQFKLFNSALIVGNKESLLAILQIKPTLFEGDLFVNPLHELIKDLIKTKSLESLNLLFSLPLYQEKSKDKWDKLYHFCLSLVEPELQYFTQQFLITLLSNK